MNSEELHDCTYNMEINRVVNGLVVRLDGIAI